MRHILVDRARKRRAQKTGWECGDPFPGVGYRAKKFVFRNQTLVVAGVLVLLLGIAYAVTVTVQANRLAEERERARKQVEAAEQTSAVLVDLFEAADPYESADTLTAETLLRRGGGA